MVSVTALGFVLVRLEELVEDQPQHRSERRRTLPANEHSNTSHTHTPSPHPTLTKEYGFNLNDYH